MKEYENQIQNAYDRGQTVDDFMAEEIREAAWHAVVNRKLLAPQFDEKLVLGYSGKEIYEKLKRNPPDWIKQHPQFLTNGNFDYQKYLKALDDKQIDWSPVERAIASNLPYDKLKALINTITFVTLPEAMDEYTFAQSKYRGEYMIIGPDCGTVNVDTSEGALKKYYDTYGDSLVRKPYVTFNYVEVELVPSKRDSQEVRVDVDTVVAHLKDGDDFEAMASAFSQDLQSSSNGGELGWFRKGQLVKEFEIVGFALDSGQISEPTLTKYGWHIIRSLGIRFDTDTVTKKTDTLAHLQHILLKVEPGFETMDSVERLANDIYDEAKKSGLEASAKKFKLIVERTPQIGKADAIPNLGLRTMLNQYAFKHKKGDIPELTKSNGKYFILSVDEVVQAKYDSFETAKWYVTKRIVQEAELQKCKLLAQGVLQRIKAGEPMKKVAEEISAQYDTVGIIGIFEQTDDHKFDPWVSGIMLGINSNDSLSAVVETDDGRFYIAHLRERQSADMSKFSASAEKTRQDIFHAKRQEAYTLWFTNLRQNSAVADYRENFMGEQEEEPIDTTE